MSRPQPTELLTYTPVRGEFFARQRTFFLPDGTERSLLTPLGSEVIVWDPEPRVVTYGGHLDAIEGMLRLIDDWIEEDAVERAPWIEYVHPNLSSWWVRLPVTPVLEVIEDGEELQEHFDTMEEVLVASSDKLKARVPLGYKAAPAPSWDQAPKLGPPWVVKTSAKHCWYEHADDASIEFGPEYHIKNGVVMNALFQVNTKVAGYRRGYYTEGDAAGLLGFVDVFHRGERRGDAFLFHRNGMFWRSHRKDKQGSQAHHYEFNEAGDLT